MKRVLVLHHTLQPPGGGNAVAAWTLQALRGRYDLTLATWRPVALRSVNAAYGTCLEPADFRAVTVAPVLGALLRGVPVPLALLTTHLLHRRVRSLLRRDPHDVVVGTTNEMDVGVRAIQYVHYPWLQFPRPDVDYRWYHFRPPLRVYRRVSAVASGYRSDRAARNTTLVNSDWTGRLFTRLYGVPARTVYPPVAGGFPDVPFAARENGFVCLGRIAPEKEIEKVVDILAGVRQRGHDVRLHVVGHLDNCAYGRRLRRAVAPHADWIAFHLDLSRGAMTRLVAGSRYGIHGMSEEHFGIGPAELQRAGCITFVPAGGGALEVVGGDERVTYRSVPEAVGKIDRVLRDDALRAALRADVQARAGLFSEDRFMSEMREVVEGFVP